MFVYTYSNCDTCRNATKWLKARKIAFVEKPIRETPPSVSELRQMLAFQGGDLKALFNVAGLEFRALGLKDKLPKMSTDQALELLSENGALVKRPFLLSARCGLVGFKEAQWAEALASGSTAESK